MALRVLSVDGVGTDGLVQSHVLAELERRSGRPVGELFDLIAGSAAGSIIACALAKGDGALPAAELSQIFEELDTDGWPGLRALDLPGDPRTPYPPPQARATVNQVLRKHLGDARLSGVRTDIIVPAYDAEGRAPFFFRSSAARAHPEQDFPLSVVARASAATPTYLPPVRAPADHGVLTLLGGDLFASNPTLLALSEALATAPHEDVQIVSLGGGKSRRPLPYEEAAGWNLAQWAVPILELAADASSEATHLEATRLVSEDRYWRFQVDLNGVPAGAAKSGELRARTEDMIVERTADIDAAVNALM